jgi:hypothetical protein
MDGYRQERFLAIIAIDSFQERAFTLRTLRAQSKEERHGFKFAEWPDDFLPDFSVNSVLSVLESFLPISHQISLRVKL